MKPNDESDSDLVRRDLHRKNLFNLGFQPFDMSLPSSRDLRFQILILLSDQQVHSLPDVKDEIARKFGVSGDDRKKLAKNKRPVFETRIINTLSILRKNGHIVNQIRGNFKITKSGLTEYKKH